MPDAYDYGPAEEDIVAHWNHLNSGDGNKVWYVDVGDLHNLMDMAVEEIARLRQILRDVAKDIEDHDCYDQSSALPQAAAILDLMNKEVS